MQWTPVRTAARKGREARWRPGDHPRALPAALRHAAGRPAAAPGPACGAVRARRHAAVQGRDRRLRRGASRGRLLPAAARGDLRRGARPLRPRRAGRRHHRLRRARQARRPRSRRWPGLPAPADLLGADRGQRGLLRPDRRRARGAAPAGRSRHEDRPARLRPGWRRRRGHRQRGAGGGLRGRRQAGRRGLPPARRHPRDDRRRDRGRLRQVRRDDRRANGFHRPRLADQRAASRANDRPGGSAGHREGAGARHAAAHPQRVDDHG